MPTNFDPSVWAISQTNPWAVRRARVSVEVDGVAGAPPLPGRTCWRSGWDKRLLPLLLRRPAAPIRARVSSGHAAGLVSDGGPAAGDHFINRRASHNRSRGPFADRGAMPPISWE